MKDRRVTIFEAINRTINEIYVGMTEKGMHDIITRHRSHPPAQIAHWEPDDEVNLCSVEFSVAASCAEEFITAHVLKIARHGWTIIAGTGG